LSNITYDDGAKGARPLFYRLSVAEMVVPYAKTIYPHHRKHAFDTGEYGIGALANSLALGCDCLGSITYLDADFVTRAGGIETIKSAICIQSVCPLLFKCLLGPVADTPVARRMLVYSTSIPTFVTCGSMSPVIVNWSSPRSAPSPITSMDSTSIFLSMDPSSSKSKRPVLLTHIA
jgi:hypothetical protein